MTMQTAQFVAQGTGVVVEQKPMVGSASGGPVPGGVPIPPVPVAVPGQLPFPPGMDPSQWSWNRARGAGLRPPPGGFLPGPGPRRGPYMRPGFFPGPRGPPGPPQQQAFFNQRKPRPNWMPRLARLPHFPSNPADPGSFVNFPPPGNWSAQPPPAGSTPDIKTEDDSSQQSESPHPPKKKKRTTNGVARPWDREAAELALKTEMEYKKNAGANALVIKFPDPELSKEIVQRYNSAIDNVHFQGPCCQRYCFVTLKEGANIEKVMKELNEVDFGTGKLMADRKQEKAEENVKPEDIDPYTLFIGNLPANISTVQVKEKFPTALRIDVGYAQKMKYTRYAFARYSTTEAALAAYKESINTVIASRSIVLRFRRNNAQVGPPGEKPAPSVVVEVNTGPKLTVGDKLKAKREKEKLEKAQRARLEGRDDSDDDDASDEGKVSLEDDDSNSDDANNGGDDDVDDDDDDGEEEFEDDDDDEEGDDDCFKREIEDDDDDDDDGDGNGGGFIGSDYDDSLSDDDEEVMKDTDFFERLKSKPKPK